MEPAPMEWNRIQWKVTGSNEIEPDPTKWNRMQWSKTGANEAELTHISNIIEYESLESKQSL
jgi:hypothetical protein